MKRLLFTFVMVISASAFAQHDFQITGCTFSVITSFKKEKFASTMNWIQSFQAEGRQGWGFPMKKISKGENFVGEVELAEPGMKFEVTAKIENNNLVVKAAIKHTANGVTTYHAQGEKVEVAQGSYSVKSRLEIENPLITNIKKTLQSNENTTDSKSFPENVVVYEGANVECQAY